MTGRILRWLPLIALGALAGAAITGTILWNLDHFHLGYWLQYHTGTVNEPGPYYGFFSGFGSDLGEVALAGGVATLLIGLWHKFNCHNEGCYRIGIHHIAGGGYVVCRRHHAAVTGHPHRKLSTEFLRLAHCEHLARGTAVPAGSADTGTAAMTGSMPDGPETGT